MLNRVELTRRLFLVLLGLCQGIAFVSLGVQVAGLVGSAGVLPAEVLLERAGSVLDEERWHRYPTLLWLWSADPALHLLCALGLAGSIATAAGFAPRYALALSWLAYLSLVAVGDVFLGYQWDALLLEATLFAIPYAPGGLRPDWRAPPARAATWLLRWLLFRLIFLSGLVKLAGGDETWRELSALTYHYWTQPLPNAIAWYAAQLPRWIQELCALAMFAIELVAPFLLLGPRRLRLVGVAAIVILMGGITLTGSYGFFTLLSVALCVPQLDDRALAALVPRRWRPAPEERPARASRHRREVAAALVALVLFVPTLAPALRRMRLVEPPRPLRELERALAPFRSFNAYGLFEVMTTDRPEIRIEGSADGLEWREYVFRWKPGDARRAPRSAGPHMPRLDWQMWFAALGPWQQARWYPALVQRLLEGSPAVLALFESTPFPDAPPRYVRSTRSRYRFTTPAERRATGAWWTREPAGTFLPTCELREGALRVVPELHPGR